jgi:hypothetical protein
LQIAISISVSDYDRAGSPLGGFLVSSGATVRADCEPVNSIRMVQRWISFPNWVGEIHFKIESKRPVIRARGAWLEGPEKN